LRRLCGWHCAQNGESMPDIDPTKLRLCAAAIDAGLKKETGPTHQQAGKFTPEFLASCGRHLSEAATELSALREALESLRRAHFDCEDPWYSCAKHEGYIGESDVKECTCGADECNARIDAALGLAATGAPTPGMDGKESK
jgi:hypothetical protein